MLAAVVVAGLVLQQLEVTPYPARVGDRVVVLARSGEAPLAGVEIDVEVPGGTRRPVGRTDDSGRVEFAPEEPGQFVYCATIDAVRILAPHRVVARRNHWWLAFGTVPLGLALLRRLSRERGRRGP